MTETYSVQQLAKLASTFVVKKRGKWDHAAWKDLCNDVAALEIDLDDEMQVRLGELLETLKAFYGVMPKRTKPKTKSKTRAKRKAKPKTKTKANLKSDAP